MPSSEESGRLARVARLETIAAEAIGDIDKARRWLRKPNRALQGKRPLDFLDGDAGARVVEQLLARVQHGLGA